MALIKFGAVIVDSRGSVNGHTFKQSRYGAVMTGRATPPHTPTEKQSVIRARFTGLSKSWWSELTPTLRDGWRALAAANPLPNRWGDEYPLTGLAFYVRANQRLLAAGEPALTTAPGDQTVTPCTALTLTAAAPATASITFAPSTIPANHVLVLRLSQVLSPGIANAPRDLRVCSVLPASTTSPQDISSDVSTLIGDMPTGRQLFAAASMLNTDNAAESSPVVTAAIIA